MYLASSTCARRSIASNISASLGSLICPRRTATIRLNSKSFSRDRPPDKSSILKSSSLFRISSARILPRDACASASSTSCKPSIPDTLFADATPDAAPASSLSPNCRAKPAPPLAPVFATRLTGWDVLTPPMPSIFSITRFPLRPVGNLCLARDYSPEESPRNHKSKLF